MKRLKFKKEKCIGCQLCAQICSATHEGMFIPSKARIGIETYYDKGTSLKYKDDYCILCGICVKNCPTKSITMDDKIQVDIATCDGCGICATKCPKHVVKIFDEKAHICDTCNGDPMCVQVCPQGALSFE